MSEVTPQELVEEIDYEVEDANVIPQPIDPTLTIPGEAADAKATGDAIAGIVSSIKINNKSAVGNEFTVYGGDIKVSNDEGAQTIAEALSAVASSTASDIMYDTENQVTVKAAVDDVYEKLDSELTEEQIDEIIAEVFEGGE